MLRHCIRYPFLLAHQLYSNWLLSSHTEQVVEMGKFNSYSVLSTPTTAQQRQLIYWKSARRVFHSLHTQNVLLLWWVLVTIQEEPLTHSLAWSANWLAFRAWGWPWEQLTSTRCRIEYSPAKTKTQFSFILAFGIFTILWGAKECILNG